MKVDLIIYAALIAFTGCASTAPPDCTVCPPKIIEVPAPVWTPPDLASLPFRPELTSALVSQPLAEDVPLCTQMFAAMAHDMGELLNHIDRVESLYDAVVQAEPTGPVIE